MTSHLSFQASHGVLRIVVNVQRNWWNVIVLLTVAAASVVAVSKILFLVAVALGFAVLTKTTRYEIIVHQQSLLSIRTQALLSTNEQLIGADQLACVFVNEVKSRALR